MSLGFRLLNEQSADGSQRKKGNVSFGEIKNAELRSFGRAVVPHSSETSIKW